MTDKSNEIYKSLLEQFEQLPKKDRTYFEIAGYSHYENVASNLLAFFLNPNNEHGFKNLILSALLELVFEDSREYTDIKINREVYTIKGGRIDILVETEDYLIGIENKINHSLNNNLEDYGNSLSEWAKPKEQNVYKIILSLKKEKETFDFVSITYDELFFKVKENIDFYTETVSKKWYFYLLDFIENIEKLKDNNMMFNEIDCFFINNEEKIKSLINERNSFLSKLNLRVSKLIQEINKPDKCVRQWIYRKNCLVHDFNLLGNLIAFDLYLSPKGWELQLFGRNKMSQSYVREFLILNNLNYSKNSENKYIIESFSLDESFSKIKVKLFYWFDLLIKLENN